MRISISHTCNLITDATHSKEDPLQLLGVLLGVLNRVPGELALLVVHLREIEQDGGGLEDGEALVGDGGDAAVGVDLAPRQGTG